MKTNVYVDDYYPLTNPNTWQLFEMRSQCWRRRSLRRYSWGRIRSVVLVGERFLADVETLNTKVSVMVEYILKLVFVFDFDTFLW